MKHSEQLFSGGAKIMGSTRRALFLIMLLCALVYSRTLAVPFYFDDYSYVIDNPFIRSMGDIFDRELLAASSVYVDIKNSVLSRPLSYLTFSLNYLLNGASPAGYHLVNIGIHMLNACLVYLLILVTAREQLHHSVNPVRNRLTDDHSRLLAFFVAALFAVHPVMTNAVTYITQRMTSLATLFYLLTIVLYAYSQQGKPRSLPRCYLPALVSAAAAVKSKEIAATLPLMLALYDISFLSGTVRSRVLRLAPFFALIAACLLFAPENFVDISLAVDGNPSTLQVLDTLKTSPLRYLDTSFATNPSSTVVASMTPLEYLYTQLRVIVTYQRLLLLPVGLNFVHDSPFYRSFAELPVIVSLLWHSLVLSGGVLLFRSSRASEGVTALLLRCAGFGIFWFYLALILECSLIPMDDIMLEHRLYLPAFGFLLASAALVMLAAERSDLLRAACFGGIAVIALCVALTLQRNEQWRDPLVFWQDALAKSPGKQRIHGYIGNVYRDRGDIPRALQEYRLMLAQDFRYESDHLELGTMLMENGMYREAVQVFLAALTHWPGKLEFSERLAEAERLLGNSKSPSAAAEKTQNSRTRGGSGAHEGMERP